MFEDFFCKIAKLLGEFISARIHAAPVFAPAQSLKHRDKVGRSVYALVSYQGVVYALTEIVPTEQSSQASLTCQFGRCSWCSYFEQMTLE